jgi:hypothetical protein
LSRPRDQNINRLDKDAKLQGSNDTKVNNRGARAIRVAVGKERGCSDAGDVGDDGAQRRGR